MTPDVSAAAPRVKAALDRDGRCLCEVYRDLSGLWIPCPNNRLPDSPFCGLCGDGHGERARLRKVAL